MTRTTLLVVVLVVIGAAIAAAALVSGGGGGSSDTVSVSEMIPTATTAAPTATTTATTSTSSQSSSAQVEATVTSYVQAAEEGDATTICGLQLNTGAATSGAAAAQACASKLGITLTDLPGLSQLKVEGVKVSGNTATAQLLRIGQISLVKVDGSWKVRSFSPARSKRNGGAEAPSGPNVGGATAD